MLKGKKQKQKHTQPGDTQQASELDSNMAGMWQLSDPEFKTTIINMLRTLMHKADNMQVQMDNVSGEMKILRKNNKK